MKKRTLMKKVCVFAMLCVLTMTMFMEPTFAAGPFDTERNAACQRMKEMSEMEWNLNNTLHYCYGVDDNGNLNPKTAITLFKYQGGESKNGLITRKGIPYTQVDREHSFPSNVFELKYGTKTLSYDGKTYRSIFGTDCASSVAYAWRKGTGKNLDPDFLKTTTGKIYRTKNMFADGILASTAYNSRNYLMLVGKYGEYFNERTKANSTKDVVEGLSRATNYSQNEPGQVVYNDINSKVYAAMKRGDALLYRNTEKSVGHVRLVTNVHVEYYDELRNGLKVVNPEKSYVDCIEQAGFRKTNSNWSTSWIPNIEDGGSKYTGRYTFRQLAGLDDSPLINDPKRNATDDVDGYNRRYVPIKLNVWNETPKE